MSSATLQAQYGEFDSWLSGCVEKAAEALRTDGDPSEISRQLEEQKVWGDADCSMYMYIHVCACMDVFLYQYCHVLYISFSGHSYTYVYTYVPTV